MQFQKFKNVFLRFDFGFLITVILSLAFVFPLLRPGFYSMYDDMQVARVWQMDECVSDLQLPCRWVPDLGLGYGYPLFTYYAPFPYYVMELVHLTGISFVESVKIGFILSIIIGSIFFYKFLRLRFSIAASLFGSLLFIYSPYKASDLYVRGAMGELWGMAMTAVLLYFVEKNFVKQGRFTQILLTISTFTYLISHNLSVLIFTPFIFGYIIVRFAEKKYKVKDILKYLTPMFLGFGISVFYLIPMYFEKNLVRIDTLTAGYFGYLQHFLNISQIFLTFNWGYGPSVLGPGDETMLGVGPVHSAVFLLSAAVLLYRVINKSKAGKMFPMYMIFTLLGSLFLVHEKSTEIYKLFETLQIIQFPWRFVMLAVFIIPILASYTLNFFSEMKVVWIVLIFTITIGIFYSPHFKPKDWYELTDGKKLSGSELTRQLTASIYDYLPVVAKRAPDNVPGESLILNSGKFKTVALASGSNWYRSEIEVLSENAKISLASYNYPVWKVYVDNREVEVTSSGDFGLATFDVGRGIHKIIAGQTNTTLKVISDSISLIVLALGVFYYGKLFVETPWVSTSHPA